MKPYCLDYKNSCGALGKLMGFLPALIVFFLVLSLKVWHKLSALMLGERCRFYPTCSCYAQDALLKHGLFYGSFLAFYRLLRCHPWAEGGVDQVPSRRWAILNRKS